MDTDVLIVGAGPTGLMLANQLARRGIRFRIIDRHAGPVRETRALGVQARTLEIYEKLGVVHRALELGKRGTGANLWAEGKRRGRVPLGDAGRSITPYPFILILGQDDNERIMGEKLAELGGAVEWSTELASIEQREDRAVATLKQPDGSTRAIEAAWIAGCDGARSTVREQCGIGFPGAPYEHVFFVADVVMTGTMVPDEVNVYLWRSGFHLFFPMRGDDHWRIVGILPPSLRGKDGAGFDDVVPSLRGEAGTTLKFESCSWFSTYRIHHRAATRFREGRCFVLGDAAHIHSPVGAQGMNTGLQDAYNLAWKLALVAEGRADAALLDTYDAEREPIAEWLLHNTDRGFKLIVSDSVFAGLLRTQVIARLAGLAMTLKRVQLAAFRTVSQTGIHYREGPLAKTAGTLPRDAPQAGDRFPWLRLVMRSGGAVEDLFATLDDTRFHLFAFAQPIPAGMPDFGALLATHAVPEDPANDAALDRAKIPRPSFYLVRPDGYIGLCGRTLDAAGIAHYFGETLRLR
ncbi:MAG TPA: FAD-dependent monooxygenase [Rhodanobacteraceae bacterium]|nr:FAD-dependent monooxygenase [Rhodanobacteraceae bacterium]